MSLTEEQQKKYLDEAGEYCPHCGSSDLEYGWYNDFAEGSECPVKCRSCGKKWKDVYLLVLSDIEEDDEEDQD